MVCVVLLFWFGFGLFGWFFLESIILSVIPKGSIRKIRSSGGLSGSCGDMNGRNGCSELDENLFICKLTGS